MSKANSTSEDKPGIRNPTRAIVACADPEIWQILFSVVSGFGLQPVLAETLDEVKALLTQGETAMVFVQPNFSDGGFQRVLRVADGPRSKIPVIICSEIYDKDFYIEAMSEGAFDYLAFPYRCEEVAWVVNNALNLRSVAPMPPAPKQR